MAFPMGKKYAVQLFSQHQETFLSLSIIEPFESITHSLRGMWIDVDLTFYLIMQVIAIQYIINIFSGNFVWHKLDDIQNSKKLAKYSYQLISYMNFSLVLENFQLWKKNVKENNFPKNKHFLPPETHSIYPATNRFLETTWVLAYINVYSKLLNFNLSMMLIISFAPRPPPITTVE